MNQASPRLPASISAFFPAFNDSATIASLVLTTHLVLEQIGVEFEVIVVNDGSRDHTLQILQELQKHYPRLRIVDHGINRGYGAALRSGFAASTKEWVFYTDGDSQYDVREMARLIEQWSSDYDVINGYKIGRSDPYYRVVIGALYNRFVKWLFGLNLRDIDCDFRLIRRAIFERVNLRSSSGVICVEMIRKFQDAGCRFKEVPVNHFFRAFGQSQFFNFRRLWRTFVELIGLWRGFRQGTA